MAAEELTVAALQWEAGLDPARNRAALEDYSGSADLVVLPEAFARDFGPPTDPLAPYAEAQGGPYDTAVTALAARSGSTVVAGMFEHSDNADRPFNTCLLYTSDAADE